MIDDRTVSYLLEYIACEVHWEMRDGKTLAALDVRLSFHLRKKDRVALFEYMAERFPPKRFHERSGDAIVAYLRSLKSRKRLPQPTSSPATILPFRTGGPADMKRGPVRQRRVLGPYF